MMRTDHPINSKRGGVCLNNIEHLPVIRRDDMSHRKDWLIKEITVKNERCFLTWLFRSPSQNSEQLQCFCDSLESKLEI